MTHPEITFHFTWISVPVDKKVNSYQMGTDLQLLLVFSSKKILPAPK